MVAFGWAMNSTNNNNMQMVNAPTKPQRVACRICEQIFSTPQTLISHIESSHMKNDFSVLSSSSRKPLSFPLNSLPSSSSSSSAAAAASSGPTSHCYTNSFNYQSLYNFPKRNHFDLNYYRNQFNNFGGFQNRLVAGAQPQIPAMTARNSLRFRTPQQMQLFPLQPAPKTSTDRTLPLLHQLEQRKPEISVPYMNKSVSNSIDLTLKL